jgi:uncharacterized protein YprB with RNaseH-like and TPR domain
MDIAFFDLECTNLNADFGRILCGCVRPLHTGKTTTLSCEKFNGYKLHPWNDKLLCEAIRDELEKYDIIVSWYGKLFDVKFLQARLAIHESGELTKIKHVDLFYQAKMKLKLSSNRLDNVARILHLKEQKTRLDPEVWVRATAGSIADLQYVKKHCEADVEVLHGVYDKLKKYIERVTK